MSRKAVSLPVNFLVIIILMILVVGFFFILFYSFMGQSEEAKATLDKRFVNELQNIVSEGKKVAVYPENIEIGAGKSKAVGVGISNELGSDTEFHITAACDSIIDEANQIKPCPQDKISLLSQNAVLKSNEQKILPVVIGVKKDADSGTYIINIEVKTPDSEIYDKLTHKVYMKV